MKLSNEQKRAIDIIDRNICVNAGAGTGKTEVLTRRFIEILDKGNLMLNKEVESIVAITFTVKAANEMRERIKAQLLECDSPYYQRIYDSFSQSNISTIHGFCGKIISEFSYILDVDPLFSIIEEDENQLLIEETIVEVLNDINHKGFTTKFFQATKLFDYQSLIEEIENIYLQIISTDYSFFNMKKSISVYMNSITAMQDFDRIKEVLLQISHTLENNKRSKLKKFLDTPTVSAILYGNNEISIPFLIDLLDNIGTNKKLQNDFDYLKQLIEDTFKSNEKKHKELYMELIDILSEIDYSLYNKKRMEGKLSFNDLEHLTLKILNNDYVINILHNKFRYFMIDEFQDTSSIQKEIFYKLASRNKPLDRDNLFVVGDPKQSIYGFRGADIEIFETVREDIIKSGGESIIFKENFRSTPAVMNVINNIYKSKMGDRYDPLIAKKENSEKSKVIFIYPPSDKKTNRSEEARYIAREISNQIGQEGTSLGDYTFLMRSRTGQEIYEKALKDYNLRYYSFNSTGFFNTLEIKDMISMMRLIFNDEDSFAKVGVLNGIFYYLNLSEIYSKSLYDKEDISDLLNNKFTAELNNLNINLEKYRSIIKDDSISNCILEIIEDYNLISRYNYSSESIQCQGNLYKLLNIARFYDERSITFNNFLKDIVNGKDTEGNMQVEDENSNIIKIMTIHGSKGLGFNIPVVPDLSKSINTIKDKIVFEKEYGIGINIEGGNDRYKAIRALQTNSNTVEMDNVYYVAMTRAKESLIVGLMGNDSGYKKSIINEVKSVISSDLVTTYPNTIEDIENDVINENTGVNHSSSYGDNSLEKEFPLINSSDRKVQSYRNYSVTGLNAFINENIVCKEHVSRNTGDMATDKSYIENTSTRMLGLCIHRFAELYDGDNSLIIELMREFDIPFDKYDLVERIMENFIKLNSLESSARILKEIAFTVKYNNGIFNGIMDRIEVDDEVVKVIDFKISNSSISSLRNKYETQLVFYGMILKRQYPYKTILLEIQNLLRNQKNCIELTEELLQKLSENIDSYIDFSENIL